MVMHRVIGTAGHVDHGKTRLIQALTGVDCDRLPEEKRRGLTIDLGFAPLRLDDEIVSVVDVPGHGKFLKNMLAGATGVDLVLLVVAADDGAMPQTREHLAVFRALHQTHGIVALTKIDRVSPERIQVVTAQIREAIRTVFPHGAIIPVSSETGEGLPLLREALSRVLASTPARCTDKPFRLPIDRVFKKAGFGTVVTGTLLEGSVRLGDPVEALPLGSKARVRGIQCFGESVESAQAGQRVALNLAGLDAPLERGNWIASPGAFQPASTLDVLLELEPEQSLKNHPRIRLHHGCGEWIGRIRLLDEAETYARISLEKPIVVAGDDRLVLRRYAPMEVLGGCRILRSLRTASHRETDLLPLLEAYAEADWPRLIQLESEERLPPPALALLPALTVRWGEARILREEAERIMERVETTFGQLPAWRMGWRPEEIQRSLGIPLSTIVGALQELKARDRVACRGDRWFPPDRKHHLDPCPWQRLEQEPILSKKELIATPEAELMVEEAILRGEIVLIGEGMVLPRTLETWKSRLCQLGSPFTASQAREVLGISRKWVIPLLEDLAHNGFTKRTENTHAISGK